jgi:hypothetical protein
MINAGSLIAETRDMTNGLRIKIVSVDRSGRIAIELNNESSSPTRIWKDSNSWGAARWRVLVLSKGQLEGFFQNPNRAFTRNGPGFAEIAGRAHVEQKIDLNDGDWCTLDKCPSRDQRGTVVRQVNLEVGDVVIAVYDVPVTGEAREMNVWYGVTAASATVQ